MSVDSLSEGRLRVIIREELQPLQRSMDKMKHCIEGPEGEPAKGVIVRLDRVEQSEARRSWWIGTALVTGISALMYQIVAWITGGMQK